MRDPNSPIPGFPEYTGTVRHEKKFHKTHFHSPGLRRKMYDFSKDPDYEQIRPGVWRKKKEKQDGR